MEPPEWGPVFWSTLHTITFYYPDSPTEEEMTAAKNLFNSLVYLLPCDECCEHFAGMLEEFPIEPALVGRQELSLWLYDLHNVVNERLGKKNIPSYTQVRADYLKLNPKRERPPTATPPSLPPSGFNKPNLAKAPITKQLPKTQPPPNSLSLAQMQEIESRKQQFEQIRRQSVTARASNYDSREKPGCKDCAKKRLARGARR